MLSGCLGSVPFESLDNGEIKKEKWMDGWMDGCALYIMQIGLSSINLPKIIEADTNEYMIWKKAFLV